MNVTGKSNDYCSTLCAEQSRRSPFEHPAKEKLNCPLLCVSAMMAIPTKEEDMVLVFSRFITIKIVVQLCPFYERQ